MSLTEIVGSLDIFGTLRGQTVKVRQIQSSYEGFRLENPMVKVRLRSADARRDMPSDCVRRCAPLLDEIERTGACTIVVARRHDKKGRRMVPKTTRIALDEKGEVLVPVDIAARLISHDKYGLIFDEAAPGPSGQRAAPIGAPPTPAEASRLAEFEARLAAREAELDAKAAKLDALLARLDAAEAQTEEAAPEPPQELTPEPEPPRRPGRKKRSSK